MGAIGMWALPCARNRNRAPSLAPEIATEHPSLRTHRLAVRSLVSIPLDQPTQQIQSRQIANFHAARARSVDRACLLAIGSCVEIDSPPACSDISVPSHHLSLPLPGPKLSPACLLACAPQPRLRPPF